MYKILLVDDHDIILDGLREILNEVKEFTIVGEAKNGEEAIEKAKELLPDVILLDISMPKMSGIDAAEIIKKHQPEIKILFLTQHDTNAYINQALKAGADGYMLKNSKRNELIEGLNAVLNNERFLGKRVSSVILDQMFSKNIDAENERDKLTLLTAREIEIIKFIATDISNQEIANNLYISVRTVETHRRNIMQKLEIKTVIALVKFAVKNGLVEL